LDWEKQGLMMLFELILFNSLIYFSIMLKSEVATALLVVMIIPLLSKQMKLANTSDFISFRSLLMFEIWIFVWKMITLELFLLISMITCFLEGPWMVILNFSLFFFLLLLATLYISIILLEDRLGNTFLILRIFSILLFVAWVNYHF